MRATTITTLALSLLLEPLSTGAAAAVAPLPARCHVVGSPAVAVRARQVEGNMMVAVPRLACLIPKPVVTHPTPQPLTISKGRGTQPRHPADGTERRPGALPFTGADLARWSAFGLLGATGGTVLVVGGRRRKKRPCR